MLCALTHRRLKPGAYERFRAAWQPETWPPGWVRAYHVRNVDDEDEVISFGFFDGTLEELRARQSAEDYAAMRGRTAPLVASVGVDGVFEVIEEVTPPAG